MAQQEATLGNEIFYWLVKNSARVGFRLVTGATIAGRAHVPYTGGCLLVANHMSMLDPPLVGSMLRRRVAYMARASLFENPVFGRFISALGAYPIQRGATDRQGLQAAIDIVSRGGALLVFPEGTRGDGERLQAFRRGFMLVARRARVPVVPVGIRGTDRVLGRGSKWPRPAPVSVRIGPALEWDELEGIGVDGLRARIGALAEMAH